MFYKIISVISAIITVIAVIIGIMGYIGNQHIKEQAAAAQYANTSLEVMAEALPKIDTIDRVKYIPLDKPTDVVSMNIYVNKKVLTMNVAQRREFANLILKFYDKGMSTVPESKKPAKYHITFLAGGKIIMEAWPGKLDVREPVAH